MEIRAINEQEPHPDYSGWREFLGTCEVREMHCGTIHYGLSNCNYILFPSGDVVCNYGFNGEVLMNAVKERGWKTVLTNIIRRHSEIRNVFNS